MHLPQWKTYNRWLPHSIAAYEYYGVWDSVTRCIQVHPTGVQHVSRSKELKHFRSLSSSMHPRMSRKKLGSRSKKMHKLCQSQRDTNIAIALKVAYGRIATNFRKMPNVTQLSLLQKGGTGKASRRTMVSWMSCVLPIVLLNGCSLTCFSSNHCARHVHLLTIRRACAPYSFATSSGRRGCASRSESAACYAGTWATCTQRLIAPCCENYLIRSGITYSCILCTKQSLDSNQFCVNNSSWKSSAYTMLMRKRWCNKNLSICPIEIYMQCLKAPYVPIINVIR